MLEVLYKHRSEACGRQFCLIEILFQNGKYLILLHWITRQIFDAIFARFQRFFQEFWARICAITSPNSGSISWIFCPTQVFEISDQIGVIYRKFPFFPVLLHWFATQFSDQQASHLQRFYQESEPSICASTSSNFSIVLEIFRLRKTFEFRSFGQNWWKDGQFRLLLHFEITTIEIKIANWFW